MFNNSIKLKPKNKKSIDQIFEEKKNFSNQIHSLLYMIDSCEFFYIFIINELLRLALKQKTFRSSKNRMFISICPTNTPGVNDFV